MDVLPYLTQPCQITHRTWDGPPDEYGNPTASETVLELDGAPGCFILQESRDDNTTLTNQQRETFTGYFPPGTQLTGSDRVAVAAGTFEVEGPPWHAYNPLDLAENYVEATLIQVV